MSLKYLLQLQVLITLCLLFHWIYKADGEFLRRNFPERIRIPCEDPGLLANGFSVTKRRNTLLQHYCNFGFKLIGDRRTQCNQGKWNGDRPVCAKSGCIIPSQNPENGRIQYIDQFHIGVYCSEGYDLIGNRYAYCNGSDWDRPQGGCRKRSSKVSHECDFESSDICGWVVDTSEGFKWRRAMAANVFTSFHTGPQHDHTTMKASGGHYMLMESFGATSTPSALTSPIYGRDMSLKTACCFQFYYFMYGAGVGNLNVYVKPVTKMLTEVIEDKENYVKFSKSGNQNNNWNEAHFSIDEMEDDFQIVFVADGAKNHLSDIAIDDVKIMSGTECKSLDNRDEEPDDSAEVEVTTTEESLFDTLSCVSRCGQKTNISIIRDNYHLTGLCSCHDSCIADDDCCPDYIKVCLDAPNDDELSTSFAPIATTMKALEVSTTPPTTKKSTSTTPSITNTSIATTKMTTRKPTTAKITTTTVTTTTTTTRKPTTVRNTATVATTTTTTTRKPATSTTTTTTTTTRKPTLATTKHTTPKTTSTKRTTPTTTKITTPTTTSLPITTSTKRATTSTTGLPTTKTRSYPEPISEATVRAVTDRKTATGDTMEVPRKEKSQSQTNVTKHTWEWHPKPQDNQRGSMVLFFIFGLLLTAIVVATVYRQREPLKAIWLRKILKRDQNEGGAEDSNSIIANFQHEEALQNGSSAASGSSTGNRLKLSLPGLKRAKPKRQAAADEQSSFDETENDDIPLL
ncbi:uncharacterized protein DDB_G0290587-like [Anastrepha obliqua]|uniref:uncharacterized protein DDB_G0290587-like n=1 Tax=Anastrepha obliqua TaxID=95512 RepID=UPI00240983F4|nr:uncharacterized protein DDB_G0290587-like [Anastrepha obliqua]